MSSGDVLERIAAKAVEIRRGEAELLTLAVEAEREGEAVGFGSIGKMLADVGRYGPREARRLAERACMLHERAGLSGTPLPATLPSTAAAYADGSIGGAHVDKIRSLAEELPAEVLLGDAWPIAERALAEHARQVGPRGLTKPVHEFAARLDPDGQEPDERELATPHRELRLRQRRHRFDIEGSVDLETGMKLQALLHALGKPCSETANGGEPDWRTTAGRHGDALAEIVQLATTSRGLPENDGEPFTIILTASESALETRAGSGATMDGTRIPAAQLQRISCDATVITKKGKAKRTAPPALRRALIARDRGCSHPDCDAPPAHCHAHHIHYHAAGGPTTLANMTLLCGHHHRLVHHTNWAVHIEHNRPRFTPPGYRRPAPAA